MDARRKPMRRNKMVVRSLLAGLRPQLPNDRRRRLQGVEALRHASRRRVRRPGEGHARRQPDRTQRLRHRPGQEDQARSRLSDDHRTQFRRGAPRDRLAAAHRQAQGGNAGELEAGRGRDHRGLGQRRRRPQNLPARLEGTAALYPHRAPAAGLKGSERCQADAERGFAGFAIWITAARGHRDLRAAAANNRRDEEAGTMTNAIFESVSATRPDHLQLASPATAAGTGVSPDVTGFYDEATGSIQYVVADPVTRKSAIIDPVLDFDPRSGSTRTTSADRLLKHIEGRRFTLEWILDTHPHADHFSAAGYLKDMTGASTS